MNRIKVASVQFEHKDGDKEVDIRVARFSGKGA